ncbi:MAG: SNF2-related protein [Parabacteroides sp.]
MATKYGKTWWGEQWLGALKNIDYGNRLPRGASYAKNGMVKEISFENNMIYAKVAGSLPKPYSEKISLPKFNKEQIDKLIRIISDQPSILSKLLNRQLDEQMAQLAQKAGMQLFPRSWSDLKMKCSCPDWAIPCKHLAAVIYKISMEIDNNPFLIFTLHGVDLIRELEKRGIATACKEVMAVEELSAILGEQPFSLNTSMLTHVIDHTSLPDLLMPLSDLLPESPAFCHSGDFRKVYQKELLYIAKRAHKVWQEKERLVETEVPPLDKRKECTAEEITDLHLLQQILEIDPEQLPDYQPSVVAFRQLAITCLQLLIHGCIVPQIYKSLPASQPDARSKKKATELYSILWQPAMLDPHTAHIVQQLGQAYGLVCTLLTHLVNTLSHLEVKDQFKMLFFNGGRFAFSRIGESSVPGGIRSWLDRYFLKNQHDTTFCIHETQEGFSVSVRIDNVPLQEIMTQPAFAEKRMDMLRQLTILCDIVTGLDTYINKNGKSPMQFNLLSFTPFLMQVIPAMRLLGVKVVLPKALHKLIKPQATVRLKSKGSTSQSFLHMGDLLTFDWQVALGDEVISPDEFLRLWKNAKGLMRFKEQYIYVDEAAMKKLEKALRTPPRMKSGELLQTALSGDYEGARIVLTEEVMELIRQLTREGDVPLPTGLKAQLRPYQVRGYTWMYHNSQIGFGSIIADDMGLGKTLQVITLLLKFKEEGLLDKQKVLVIVPTGLLHNWQEEVRRFAPTLSTALYHGPARNLKNPAIQRADLLLTTYGIARSDADKLKKLKLQTLVIDEAQNIKNSDTAQSKAIRSLSARNYIAMSGTPVENRLSEFWSIIDFTNKGYLGSLKEFSERYARPIQREGDQQATARFRRITAPFLMRRLKTDKQIISDLPDKIERNEWAQLSMEQTALYQETVRRCMELIEGIDEKDSESLFKRQGLILQMILALKQICNHPTQYLKDGRIDASLSGKTEMLLDLLRSIVSADEKVLVFTQFREMGELLQQFVRTELNEEPMFYHGGCSLEQRQKMVERFQQNRSDRIFILSLKAAGTGLNLTAATHVIHYDLWWNPAVEAQATDRAYRIGQHSNVQVHRFITKSTFEERIDAMIQSKRHLADITVATGENWIGQLSNKELHEIFDY